MRHKLFKINYADGRYNYIVSHNEWAGLIPLVDSMRVECMEGATIQPVSVWEVIRHIIKGG